MRGIPVLAEASVRHAAGSEKPHLLATRCCEVGKPGECTYTGSRRGYDHATQPRPGGLSMKRHFVVMISLSLNLVGVHGGALAQQTESPGTVTLNGVSGSSLLGPDGTYRVIETSPAIINVPGDTYVEIVPAAAPEPLADTTEDETSEPVATDTDGDGVSDGGVEMAASTELVAGDGAAPEASGDDSDHDRLVDTDEAAVGTDPTTPDADGDGYYDGDEVNLRTDPLDPASVPVG